MDRWSCIITPRVSRGCNILTSCVCLSVCLCVRLIILPEQTNGQAWTLACRSGLSISRMSWNVKVIGQRSRSWHHNQFCPSMYHCWYNRLGGSNWHRWCRPVFLQPWLGSGSVISTGSSTRSVLHRRGRRRIQNTRGSSDPASRITSYLEWWSEQWSSQQDHFLSRMIWPVVTVIKNKEKTSGMAVPFSPFFCQLSPQYIWS